MGRILIRFLLPGVLAIIVGFLALAFAVPNEPTLSTAFVSVFSPGLKVAELTVPARHESLATTFGWFLRIAIGVNAAFYFLLFAGVSHLLTRRR